MTWPGYFKCTLEVLILIKPKLLNCPKVGGFQCPNGPRCHVRSDPLEWYDPLSGNISLRNWSICNCTGSKKCILRMNPSLTNFLPPTVHTSIKHCQAFRLIDRSSKHFSLLLLVFYERKSFTPEFMFAALLCIVSVLCVLYVLRPLTL